MRNLHTHSIKTKESDNKIKEILIYSLLVFLYITIIWYPFWHSVAPKDESTMERAYTWAHLICILIFLPTLFYLWFINKHIKKIKKYRIIVYPIVYIVCFILLHAGLMSLDPVLLWYMLITIPWGLIWLIVFIVEAIINDIKDRKEEKNFEKEKAKAKK
jgi:CDP-diglyceride synthetase